MRRGAFIIAEAGVNHNGSLDRALELVDKARWAGADAVKFQVFRAHLLSTAKAPKADYQKTGEPSESQREMLKRLELKDEAFREIAEHARKQGLDFLATPFDDESLEFLTGELGLKRIKVSSGDLTHAPLLFKMARKRLRVILSTGMASLDEVEEALAVLAFGYVAPVGEKPSRSMFESAYESPEGRQALKSNVTLLHCTTEYPAPLDEVNLLAMDTLRERFGVAVGLSDHTLGSTAAIAAAARGAAVIEKHITLDKKLEGPDHRASLDPEEFRHLVFSIRDVEKAMGRGDKKPTASELKNRIPARRSLVAAVSIKKGESFSEGNVIAKRPGGGVSPMRYWDLLGELADRDYLKDEEVAA